MVRISRRAGFVVGAMLTLLTTLAPPHALATQPDGDDDEEARPGAVTEVVVTAHRFDSARANVEPSLGASTYSLSNDAVERLPGGETTNLSQVLLQAPGVTQGGQGRLHVRDDRGDLQYRINNVILPEGLSDFGQVLSPRLADRVELITGALPAQYGLHGAGVVNITTKSGVYLNGGQAELYGGSHGEFEPALEYGGSAGGTNVFISASYLRSDVGVDAPDGSAKPLHDHIDQVQGFAFVDHVVDAQTRISLMLGASDERFQIPNPRGLNALTYVDKETAFQRPLVVDGISRFPSEQLDQNQGEIAQFAILSYLRTTERATLQVSAFANHSTLTFHPDGLGDLLFRGLSQSAAKTDLTVGLQVEGVYRLEEAHTLRAGLVVSGDRARSESYSRVLAIDALGRQITDSPRTSTVRAVEDEEESSAFVQDEWKPIAPLTVNVGLRFDHTAAARHENYLSPRINVVWTAREGLALHAGYARYFIPAPSDAGAAETAAALVGTTGAPPTLHGDPLRSETDDYYDVGVQQKLGALTLGLDIYLREARNLIEDGQFGAALIRTAFNYQTGRIRGVEASLTYAEGPFSAWSNLAVASAQGRRIVSNQFNFTQAELDYVDSHFIRMDHDQTFTASAGAAYRWGPLHVSGDLIYGSGFRTTPFGRAPNSGSLPGYVQMDLAMVYRLKPFANGALDIRLDVINAWDRTYQISDGSGLGAGARQWGPRRGVFVGVEQSF